MKSKLEQVIISEHKKGKGTWEDPVRKVTKVFTVSGDLIAENDTGAPWYDEDTGRWQVDLNMEVFTYVDRVARVCDVIRAYSPNLNHIGECLAGVRLTKSEAELISEELRRRATLPEEGAPDVPPSEPHSLYWGKD